MTASEFNEIDNTFFLIEEKTKLVCERNNVYYYNYLGVFKNLLINHISNKNNIYKVKSLDFNDKIKARAILNKSQFSSKESEIKLAINLFKQSRENLFNWLDKTKDPYFFILNPIYVYGSGIDYKSHLSNVHGYIKNPFTGIQNLDIACEYANYKIQNH